MLFFLYQRLLSGGEGGSRLQHACRESGRDLVETKKQMAGGSGAERRTQICSKDVHTKQRSVNKQTIALACFSLPSTGGRHAKNEDRRSRRLCETSRRGELRIESVKG